MKRFLPLLILLLSGCAGLSGQSLRGTGDLGIVIQRADGAVSIVETTGNSLLGEVGGLGDLSHASAVYSRDARYAFVFGRDGGLSKVDLLTGRLVGRVMQSGNSIGGAISQDGRWVAVSNYTPGGVRIFDAETLELKADIPARYGQQGKLSKVIGLVDAPGNRFVFSLWDAGEIWVVDVRDIGQPKIRKFRDIGRNPYDALITPDGRYYIAGLFGEDGMALLDLWNLDAGVRRILPDYGKGEKKLPVYKMPHLEGWAIAGRYAFVPAVGLHEVLVIDTLDWSPAGRIPVHGQPVFVMARPDGRQVWVNFAVPDNDTVQVIDTRSMQILRTLKPGKGVLHMEFEPRGEQVWLSVRDRSRVQIYDTETLGLLKALTVPTPSGIFFTDRAHRIGL
jgi:protein NirF